MAIGSNMRSGPNTDTVGVGAKNQLDASKLRDKATVGVKEDHLREGPLAPAARAASHATDESPGERLVQSQFLDSHRESRTIHLIPCPEEYKLQPTVEGRDIGVPVLPDPTSVPNPSQGAGDPFRAYSVEVANHSKVIAVEEHIPVNRSAPPVVQAGG
jgi:hypothetical protein